MTNSQDISRKNGSQQIYLLTSQLSFAAGPGAVRKPRTFTGVAYSGEAITDHWFYDRVIFDLEGMKFSHERMPVLLGHDSGQILGYTTGFSKEGSRLEVAGVFLDGSAEAQRVISMADEGYPWQMSVNISPDSEQRIKEFQKMSVNGRIVEGPFDLFTKSTIREVSFCAVGADRGTSTRVFSVGKPISIKEKAMDSINLPAETSITVPNFNTGTLDRDLAIQTLSDEKNGFAAKCGALEAERAKLTAEAAELKGQVKSLNFELTALKDSLTKGPGRSRSSAEREGGVHLGSPGNSFWGMISRSWG